jgi:hypothetical protein
MNEFYVTGNTNLSLTKALDEHYLRNPQFTRWHEYKTNTAQKLVRAHDIVHIVFGCDTSLLGEMRVQIWTKYATPTLTVRQKIEFLKNKESRVLLKNPVGYFAMMTFFVDNLKEFKKVKNNSKFLTKSWIYFDTETYENRTIGEIRNEFGIEII